MRYFIPPLAVIGIFGGLILGVLGVDVHAVDAARVRGTRCLRGARDRGIRHRGPRRVHHGLWFLVVLPCIHFGWGTGFVLGFLKITRNITAHGKVTVSVDAHPTRPTSIAQLREVSQPPRCG